MATTLEQYYQTKQQLNAKIASGEMTMDQLLGYQELLYRISVLESCMNFVKTAPVTDDTKAMCYHYQVVEALATSLLTERQYGIPADEKLRNQRATAQGNLQTVVNSFRKKFQSFAPKSQDEYRNIITQMIETILPAWMSYRNTFVSL